MKLLQFSKPLLSALLIGAALFLMSVNAFSQSKIDVKEVERLAEQGSAVYQFKLAQMLANGDGVIQDFKTAEFWLQKAAAQDYDEAQSMLGLFYYFGINGEQDYGQALSLLTKAARQQNPIALFHLGMMNLNGDGLEPNPGLAFRYIKGAAEKEYAPAQYNLGVLYEAGTGIESDPAQAFVWYKKAAEQDMTAAQVNLAFMYEEGRGTLRNEEKALEWFAQAAAKYDAVAMLKMAEAYFSGRFIRQDLIKAYVLVNLALQKEVVLNHDEVVAAAQKLAGDVSRQLSETERAEADKLVQQETARNLNAG